LYEVLACHNTFQTGGQSWQSRLCTHLRAGAPWAQSQCGWLKDRFGLSWQIIGHQGS